MALSVPASLLAAYAHPTRCCSARACSAACPAGMAYPIDARLITALWSGRHARARLRSGRRSGAASRRSAARLGALLEHFSVGLRLPRHAAPRRRRAGDGIIFVPTHVDGRRPSRQPRRRLSVTLVGALILAINFAPVPNIGALTAGLAVIAPRRRRRLRPRQRRAATRSTTSRWRDAVFSVAACAGIIVFGSLVAAAFVSQQYLRNVLGFSTLEAGAAILPAVVSWCSWRRARPARRGARRAFHVARRLRVPLPRLPRDAAPLAEGSSSGRSRSAYVGIGVGVGLAARLPRTRSPARSGPSVRGWHREQADLQRGLGGRS